MIVAANDLDTRTYAWDETTECFREYDSEKGCFIEGGAFLVERHGIQNVKNDTIDIMDYPSNEEMEEAFNAVREENLSTEHQYLSKPGIKFPVPFLNLLEYQYFLMIHGIIEFDSNVIERLSSHHKGNPVFDPDEKNDDDQDDVEDLLSWFDEE